MTTKVKKFTGGVPNLPGQEGTSGQVLVKLSNAPGDYAWGSPSVQIGNLIQDDDSKVEVRTDSGNVEVIVNGELIATFKGNTDTGLELLKLNGVAVDTGVINPGSPPPTATEMLATDPPNNQTKYSWTPDEIATLIAELAPGGSAPTGMIAPFAMMTPPAGWLECNGQSVSPSEYPDLYAAIGDTYTTIFSGIGAGNYIKYNPNNNHVLVTCISLQGDIVYVYKDTNIPQYRLRRVDMSYDVEAWDDTFIWDKGIVGQIGIDNGSPRGFIDYDNAGNIYVRYANAELDFNFGITKYDSDGNFLFSTPVVANKWAGFVVNKVTQEVYYTHRYTGNSTSGRLFKANPDLLTDAWNIVLGSILLNSSVQGIDYDPVDNSVVAVLYRSGEVFKVDASGSQVWSTTLPGAGLNYRLGLQVLPNRNIVVYKNSSSTPVLYNPAYDVVDKDGVAFQSRNSFITSEVLEETGTPTGAGFKVAEDGFLYVFESASGYLYAFKVDPDDLTQSIGKTQIVFTSTGSGTVYMNDSVTYEPGSGGILLGGRSQNYFTLITFSDETFNIPDLRGEFIRGWSNGIAVDSGRSFASYQEDAIRNLTGGLDVNIGWSAGLFVPGEQGVFKVTDPSPNRSTDGRGGGTGTGRRVDFDASLQVPTADENRPRNVALMYCIKT